VGLFSEGIGTGRDTPKEHGLHWGGFGDRYGMRLTGTSTGNVIEAGSVLYGERILAIVISGTPLNRFESWAVEPNIF
jgi:hypothetical protein